MKPAIFSRISIIAILLFNTLVGLAQQPNYSGAWLLDSTASEFGQTPSAVMPKAFNVKQSKDSISIGIGLSYDSPKNSPRGVYSLNGNPSERFTADGTKIIGYCKFLAEGKKLYRSQTIFGPQQLDLAKSKSTEEWELSNNGKHLTMMRKVEVDGKQLYTIKAAYNFQTMPN